jgi:hypothetical protein
LFLSEFPADTTRRRKLVVRLRIEIITGSTLQDRNSIGITTYYSTIYPLVHRVIARKIKMAAANGHEEVVKVLLDTGKVDPGTKDKYD